MTDWREYPAIIHRWVDGDTVDLTVDPGFRMTFRDRFRLVTRRGGYYNAPEVRGAEREDGIRILNLAHEIAPPGSKVTVRTFKDDSRGKYGRWLAAIDVAGIDIATFLGQHHGA